jgi:hypothetical protein
MPAAALLLLAAAPAPAPAAYPADAVLAAFATACSGAESAAVNRASVEAAGWERLPADADTQVSRLVRQGRAAAGKDGEAVLLEGGEYRKSVAGRTLHLAISGARIGKHAQRGCRLFDFAAPRAPSVAELERWAVRPPVAAPMAPAGVVKYTWNPGLKPGHMAMELFFISPGASPLPGFETSGLTLVASVLE